MKIPLLIIGNSNDLHLNKIYLELVKREILPIWFKTDIHFENIPLVKLFNNSEGLWDLSIDNYSIYENVKVFCYQNQFTFNNFSFVNDSDQQLTKGFWNLFLKNTSMVIPANNWYNHPSNKQVASNIFFQQKIAVKNGFKVPKTIITNNIERLKDFDDEFLIKLGNNTNKPTNGRILANKISYKDVKENGIIGSPVFCQEYIEKDFELRIHVIGKVVLSCKIDSQKSEKTKIDWRRYDISKTPHTVYNLPEQINIRLINLVNDLGLNWGIIDCIVDKHSEIVFLECNTDGHWDWIESLTKLPITESICDLLLS